MALVILTPPAEREYKHLPRDIQQVVQKLLDGDFCVDPLAIRFKARKVQVPFTGYRLRLREYRLLFELEGEVILVYRIRHRKDAYK